MSKRQLLLDTILKKNTYRVPVSPFIYNHTNFLLLIFPFQLSFFNLYLFNMLEDSVESVEYVFYHLIIVGCTCI